MTRQRSLLAGGARWLRVAVAASLAVASCGEDDGQSGTRAPAAVRPFEEVQASDFAFEADPTDPGRGIFRVTTTEPMICAIVWGEDDTFGRFNNSLSMIGTGIEQHDVLLPDVEAGVEYRYIVQGTTADGTLYRSEVASFRIDPATTASTAVARGENLALDASVVEVSSEFSADFAGSFAIDGDTATEWSTSGDGDDGFINPRSGSGSSNRRRRVRNPVDGGRHGPNGSVHRHRRRRRGPRSVPGGNGVTLGELGSLG